MTFNIDAFELLVKESMAGRMEEVVKHVRNIEEAYMER